MGYQRLAAEIGIVASSSRERWRVGEGQQPPTRPGDVGMWWMTRRSFLPFSGPVHISSCFRRRSHCSCNPQSSASRGPAAPEGVRVADNRSAHGKSKSTIGRSSSMQRLPPQQTLCGHLGAL